MKETCLICGAENEYSKKNIIENTTMVSCKTCGETFRVNDFIDYVTVSDGSPVKRTLLELALYPYSVEGFTFTPLTKSYNKGSKQVYVNIAENYKTLDFAFEGNWSDSDKESFKSAFAKKIINKSNKLLKGINNVCN